MILVSVVVGALTLMSSEASDLKLTHDLKPLWPAPSFTLVERSGQMLSNTDLLGKVWIANLIFTQCTDTCPLGSQRMIKLQDTFAAEEDVRLVSVTVDPAHDTPEVLSQYAKKLGAHPQRWLFLTGTKKQIYRLAREGFRMGVMDLNDERESSTPPALPQVRWLAQRVLQHFKPSVAWAHRQSSPSPDTARTIQHSERFVLVDRRGQIRRYYNGKDAADMGRLQDHVRLLVQDR